MSSARNRPALAAALLFALIATACGGVCSDVEAAWQDELRREQALVGPGVTALGSREVHLGVTLSQDLLQLACDPLNAALPVLETRVSAGERGERRAAVEISARPVIERLELIGTQWNAVRLHVRIETNVIVRRPGTRREHYLPGRAVVAGGLELRQDEAGEVVLYLRPVLDQPQIEGLTATVEQPVETLSASVAQTVRDFVEPGVEAVLTRQAPIPILRFRDPVLGPLTVALAPAELRSYPDQGSIFLGFVTNLRPLPRAHVAPQADVSDVSMRYFVHPGLPAAAVRLAFAEGAVDREMAPIASVSDDGAEGVGGQVSFDDLALADGGFELRLRGWDYNDWCGLESWEARGAVTLDKGTVSLELQEVTGEGGAEAIGPERVTDVVARSLNVAQALVDVRGVVLGDGTLLELAPSEVVMAEDRVEVLFGR